MIHRYSGDLDVIASTLDHVDRKYDLDNRIYDLHLPVFSSWRRRSPPDCWVWVRPGCRYTGIEETEGIITIYRYTGIEETEGIITIYRYTGIEETEGIITIYRYTGIEETEGIITIYRYTGIEEAEGIITIYRYTGIEESY